MKFLITGSSGFVGKPLCVELLRQGQDVRAVMRSIKSPIDNVETAIVGDINGETQWAEAVNGIDVIVHLAARVHVLKEHAANPLDEFLRVNLHGTINLARQAAEAGVQRFVYVSSVGVNGNCTDANPAYSESDIPHPHNAYALSKWQAEQALWAISRGTGMEVVVVRPPLVYGPAAKGNFAKLLAAIEKGIPLPLAGAENARSLIYVGNLVDVLITCATSPAAAGQTYLIRDGQDVSTADLIEKIALLMGQNSRLFYFPPTLLRKVAALFGRSAQVDQLFSSLRVCDDKIRRELGWTPPYTMDQGLRATTEKLHSESTR